MLFLSVFFAILTFASASVDKMVVEVESVNQLRESLVKGVTQEKVDLGVFKAVCAPVGQKAQSIAKKRGWLFRQVSEKNRNPNNAANELEKKALVRFNEDEALQGFWAFVNNQTHYFRRITVRSECLHCHGAKDKRPDFVLKKYPGDKAFGFKAGDLRGLYHVFK